MPQSDRRDPSAHGAVAHQILIVEDDAETAQQLKAVLEENRFSVNIAKDGGQAQSNFVMRRPDFIILDLILPGESGFEICERFKQKDETVPILILSVIDMEDSRNLAMRIGADGYMTKPYDPNELVEQIQSIAEQVWERSHSEKKEQENRIRFACVCGKKFKVSSMHRGKTLTCPKCGESVMVPTHE